MISQEGRWLSIDGPPGQGSMLLTSFDGGEHLSRPYRFRLNLLVQRDDLTADEILGKGYSVTLRHPSGAERVFHGLAATLVSGNMAGRGTKHYQVEIVPWLWFLSLRSDCRIFENMSVRDILNKVFQDADFNDFDDSGLTGHYAKREYCVQYNETDLDFVSRLMEQEGIFYFFRHQTGKHTLVLADQRSAYFALDGGDVLHSDGFADFSVVSNLERSYQVRSGKVTRRDYDAQAAQPIATTLASITGPASFRRYELFGYADDSSEKAGLEGFTRIRIEGEEARHNLAQGQGSRLDFQPGGKLTLERQPDGARKSPVAVLTRVHHHATDDTHTGNGTPPHYSNDFDFMGGDAVFRPPRHTPRPRIQGPQTAIVIGPDGEEIHCDPQGRIRVRFHWDRKGMRSCWARVAQLWAGNGWGGQFLPRIGMEVVVVFLDGDPDRPLVTGCVYNGRNRPPFPPAGDKTQSGIRSRSSIGGGASEGNELRFEDKRGAEEIYLHAQRDRRGRIRRNDSLEVGNNQSVSVGNNQNVDVGHDHSLEVGHDHTVSVDHNQTVDIGKNQTQTVMQNRSARIRKGDDSLQIDQGNSTITVAQGDSTITVAQGRMTVTAMTSIQLKVGDTSLTLTPEGITLNGPTLTLNGTATVSAAAPSVKLDAQAILKASGLLVKLDADGLMSLTAPMVKVN